MALIKVFEENLKDREYHLGHMFMDCMTRRSPEYICQIDASTGETETYGSVLSRSIRLARCLRRLGLQPGDVLALDGRNHLDLHIPYYAGLLNGLPVVGVDPFFQYYEIKTLIQRTKPKIVFCQYEKYQHYVRAATELGIHVKIVTFGDGECTMRKLMDTDGKQQNEDDFQPATFDTDVVYAWLVSTSGTTGLPKVAAFKHQPLVRNYLGYMKEFPDPDNERNELALNISPVQRISSYFQSLAMLLRNSCRLQSSRLDDIGHTIDVINQYRPKALYTSPIQVNLILKHEKRCDMSCFRTIVLTGSKVFKELVTRLKTELREDAVVIESYGQTEIICPILTPNPRGPSGNCGTPSSLIEIKLMNLDSSEEITEANVTGEMWTKGPSFTEYYNNRVETAEAFTIDGWYRTGDLLYKDEDQNYYYVDRLKTLIKFRSYHVMPSELEEVIGAHEAVLEVGVTSVPHPEDGQHPVACVVRRAGYDVTAHEIKKLVIEILSPNKELRGGVVFLNDLPKTSAGKVSRVQLKEIALNSSRE